MTESTEIEEHRFLLKIDLILLKEFRDFVLLVYVKCPAKRRAEMLKLDYVSDRVYEE